MFARVARVVLVAAVTISCAARAQSPVSAPATPPGDLAKAGSVADVEKGYRLFVAQGCYQCHGYVGQGSQATGPALVPLALTDVGFRTYIRSPRGVMPPYSARILPRDSVTLILAYIRSLKPGRAASEIPALARYGAAARARPGEGKQ